jgi:cytochrome d ubiquinol oxidase subunit II
MNLQILWFVIVAVFWTGFFVLEGFDFGVGALHRVVGRTEDERRVAINAIGPLWDGNEVWLVVAGAAMFAAFPAWYATWFSALYLALVLVLVALIIRGVSFDFRGQSKQPRWRRTWSTTLTVGSILAPLLIGIGLGDLLVGLPIDQSGEFTGSFWSLLTPYGLVMGITLLVLCLMHGAAFLALKTEGDVQTRAFAAADRLRWATLLVVLVEGVWTFTLSGRSILSVLLGIIGIAAAIGAFRAVGLRRDGWAFVLTAITIGSTVASVFAGLYPNVMVSSTDPSFSLTIAGAASSDYALTVMTWVAVVLLPLVLLYQGWTAYVFRARLSTRFATSSAAAAS